MFTRPETGLSTTTPRRSGGSLGRRLVLATLVFCLVFTLITVGVRTWTAWRNNLATMTAELTLIDQVFQRTLTKAILGDGSRNAENPAR